MQYRKIILRTDCYGISKFLDVSKRDTTDKQESRIHSKYETTKEKKTRVFFHRHSELL